MDDKFLADLVLVLHVAVALFIVAGLPLAWLGHWREWAWTRAWRFRAAHLAAIGFVVVQQWAGLTCPLTTLESSLRIGAGELAYQASFVEDWLQRLLFWEAPSWVFTAAYSAFAAAVALTWWLSPPVARKAAAAPGAT